MGEKLSIGIDVKASGADAILSKLGTAFRTLAKNVQTSATALAKVGDKSAATALSAVSANMNSLAGAVEGGTKSVDKFNKSMDAGVASGNKLASTSKLSTDALEYYNKKLGGTADSQKQAIKSTNQAISSVSNLRGNMATLGITTAKMGKNLEWSTIQRGLNNKSLALSGGQMKIVSQAGANLLGISKKQFAVMNEASKSQSVYNTALKNAGPPHSVLSKSVVALGKAYGTSNLQAGTWVKTQKTVSSNLASSVTAFNAQGKQIGLTRNALSSYFKQANIAGVSSGVLAGNIKTVGSSFKIMNEQGLAPFNNMTEQTAGKLGLLDKTFKSTAQVQKEYDAQWKSMGRSMPQHAELIGRLNSKIANGTLTSEKAVNGLNNYNTRLAGATKESTKFGKALEFVGNKFRSFLAYSLAAASVAGSIRTLMGATAAVIQHSQALKDLEAIIGATTFEISRMDTQIREVASSTKFSAAEVAQGMKLIGQAGFSASESMKTIQAVSDLATGTLSTLATSADLVTTTLRVFKIEATESATVVDVFTNAVNNSKLTIDKIKTAMNYLGPIAARAGISFRDTAASMMILANSGMRASSVATGLRRVMKELVSPSAKMTKAIEDAGLQVEDLSPQFHDMRAIIDRLTPIVTDASSAFELFGLRGATAASALVTQGVPAFDKMRAAVENQGTAALNAQIQMEGLGVSYKNLQDKAKNLALAMGDGGLTTVLKVFVDIARGLVDIIKSIVESPLTKWLVGVIALLGSSVILVVAYSKAISGLSLNFLILSKRVKEVSGFLMALGPWKLVIAAVVALGLAYLATRKSLDELLNASRKQQRDAIKTIAMLKQEQEIVRNFNGTSKDKLNLLDDLAEAYPKYAEEIYKTNGNLVQLEETLKRVQEAQEALEISALTTEFELLGTKLEKQAAKIDKLNFGGNLVDKTKAQRDLDELIGDVQKVYFRLEKLGVNVDITSLLPEISDDELAMFSILGMTYNDIENKLLAVVEARKQAEDPKGLSALSAVMKRIEKDWDKITKPAKKAGDELIKIFEKSFAEVKDSFTDASLFADFEAQITELNLNMVLTEEERERKIAKVRVKAVKEKIRLTKKGTEESLRLLNYGQTLELLLNEKLNRDIEKREKGKLDILDKYAEKRKALYVSSTSDLKSELEASVDLYREYSDNVIDIEEKIRKSKQSAADAIRDIQQKGMTDEEKHNDMRLELAQNMIKMKKLENDTSSEGMVQFEELYKKSLLIAKQTATEVKRSVWVWKDGKKEYKEGAALVSTAAEQSRTSTEQIIALEKMHQTQLGGRKSVLQKLADEQKNLSRLLVIDYEMMAISAEKYAIQGSSAFENKYKGAIATVRKELDDLARYLNDTISPELGIPFQHNRDSNVPEQALPINTQQLDDANARMEELKERRNALLAAPPVVVPVQIEFDGGGALPDINNVPGSTEGKPILKVDADASNAMAAIREPLNMVQELGNSLDSVWTDLFEGKVKTFSDLWSGVMDSVTNTFQKAMADMTSMYVNDFLQQIMGKSMSLTGGSGSTSFLSSIGDWVGGLFTPNAASTNSFASGGIIPEHVVGMGLSTGTKYQFGEKGPERVISNKDSFAQEAPNVSINIENNSSSQVQAKQSQPRFDGKKMVIDVILEDYINGGPIYRTMGR
jgi:TP901 family phage tail tape measure protein